MFVLPRVGHGAASESCQTVPAAFGSWTSTVGDSLVCQPMQVVDHVDPPGCSDWSSQKVEATQSVNRRNLVQQMKKRAKTTQDAAASLESPSQKRSPAQLSSGEVAELKRRRVAPPHHRSTGDPHLQARESIFAWSGEWTYRRQIFISSLPWKQKPLLTRRYVGGSPVALRNFHYIFELVGGNDWYHTLSFSRQGWKEFLKRALEVTNMEEAWGYCFFKQCLTAGVVREVEEVEKTEEQQRKEDEKKAKRLAHIYEHASRWTLEPRDSIPMELLGDSSTGVNWINGLWATSNKIYKHIMGDIQNRLEHISTVYAMRPPSWGHNMLKWIYREGNERADRLTWLARKNNCYVQFHTSLLTYASKNKLDGLRGFFDGGRSREGCAAGWCIDLCIHGTWQLVAEEAFALHPSASVMFCEMIAAQRLCMAVEHVLSSIRLSTT